MPKVVVGDVVTGLVVNIYAPAPPDRIFDEWVVDDDFVVSVGDPFDPKDPEVDAMARANFHALRRLENNWRRVVRAMRRMGAAANNACDAEGLPTSDQVPDLTRAEARDLYKQLMV